MREQLVRPVGTFPPAYALGAMPLSEVYALLNRNLKAVVPKLVVGSPCPTCGKKVGQRAYRERKEGS